MKRALFAIVLITALVTALPANGRSEDMTPAEEGRKTVTYFTFSAAPDHLGDLDEMIAAFEAENPDVEIKVESAPWGEYFTKLQTLVAGEVICSLR